MPPPLQALVAAAAGAQTPPAIKKSNGSNGNGHQNEKDENNINDQENNNNDDDNMNNTAGSDGDATGDTPEAQRQELIEDVAEALQSWINDAYPSSSSSSNLTTDENTNENKDNNDSATVTSVAGGGAAASSPSLTAAADGNTQADEKDQDPPLLSITYINKDLYPCREWLPLMTLAAQSHPPHETFHTGGTYIELSGSELGLDGARHMADFFLPHVAARCRNGAPTLTLDLQNTRLLQPGFVVLADGVVRHCAGCLKSLSVRENFIRDDAVPAVNRVLAACSHLQELTLGTSSLFPEGAALLAQGLLASPTACMTLQTLSLEFNTLGDPGVVALCPALAKCFALTDVNLSDNSIGDEGAEAIATHLLPRHCCGPLRKLDLSVNKIGPVGAGHFAAAFMMTSAATALSSQPTAIEHFDIGCNPLTDAGVMALSAAVVSAPRLRVMDFTACDAPAESGPLLVRAMNERPTLHGVRIYECQRLLPTEAGQRVQALTNERRRGGQPLPAPGPVSNAVIARQVLAEERERKTSMIIGGAVAIVAAAAGALWWLKKLGR